MSVSECLLLVAACGAAGGVTACFQKEGFVSPKIDKRTKTWKPGAIGTIFIGAVAADLIWALYGPASSYDFAKNVSQGAAQSFPLPLSQLAGSFVTGLGGGTILTLLAKHNADQFTKGKLSKDIKTIVDIKNDE